MEYVGLNGSTMMERNILINLERNLGMSTRIHSVNFHIDWVSPLTQSRGHFA
jgi:hypothetical protein